MEPTTIGLLVGAGRELIARIWPDPAERHRALIELERLEQEGDLKQLELHVRLLEAQASQNREEAKHSSVFVAGWRPAVGWGCAISVFAQFTILPLSAWLLQVFDPSVPAPPQLDITEMVALLGGMLGIGGMRSWEKKAGVARESL